VVQPKNESSNKRLKIKCLVNVQDEVSLLSLVQSSP